MQDTEFTVEDGQLYMLQTRNAKRPAQAAVRFACDAVDEELLTTRGGARDDRRRARSTRCCTRRSTPRPSSRCWRSGVSASPGAAKGEVVFTAADAVAAGRGRARRDPRAPVHRGRRRRRLPRGEGDPHDRGRQGVARRARRPRHGAARRWSGADALAIDLERQGRSASTAQVRPRGRLHRDRRHERLRHARGRPAASSPRSTSTSSACSSGPTRSAGWACGRTPTRPRTPGARASWAPRASACAAPSTCSWPRTASRRCGR